MNKRELKHKLIILLVFTVLFAAVYSYISYTLSVDLGDTTVSIIIAKGDGFSKVAAELLEQKVVKSRFVIKVMAKIRGVDTRLVPGRYDFTGENSCQSVLDRLKKGDFLRLKVTIPEGNTIWETSALLANRLNLDSAEIHNLAYDTTFLKKHNIPYLEGYLFPETYFIPWGSDERKAVGELISLFHRQTASFTDMSAPNSLSFEQVIIMASIIESETGLVDERTMVSSVYHNRLTKNMKLDADPTVIYGLGGLDRPLYHKDLRKDTPYNTYLRKGLTPTPINSPGLASIKAALTPDKTDYLFFVANDSGRHIFSRTNAEHNRAVQRIRSNR